MTFFYSVFHDNARTLFRFLRRIRTPAIETDQASSSGAVNFGGNA